MSGTIDGATGISTAKHIYVADKGDYYDIADNLPQHDQ
ncbi:Glutathione-dependent formaldehyde-activating, GFA [Sulfitobacter noctilucae]|nr:Glutathione-dependent formaldehyde-activating, GFA [Sulfitobacter noctilucae]